MSQRDKDRVIIDLVAMCSYCGWKGADHPLRRTVRDRAMESARGEGVMKAVIESYVPSGAHPLWDRGARRIREGVVHRDWRYKIMPVNSDIVVYRRSGFCSWVAAAASLEKAWPKVEDALMSELVD